MVKYGRLSWKAKKRFIPFNKKRLKFLSVLRKPVDSPFRPHSTSTPKKGNLTKDLKRKLTFSFSLTPRKSPLHKKLKFELLQLNKKDQLNESEDETFIYSLEDLDVSDKSCHEELECVEGNATVVDSHEKDVIQLISESVNNLNNRKLKNDLLTFLKLIVDKKFPLDNVAFLLFLDVLKWYNCSDIRGLRYSDTSLKFFWIGRKLFGGRFIRFMSGPKNETDVIQGKPILSPEDSKINFACPSEEVLRNYNPLGQEMNYESGPGMVKSMVNLTLKTASPDKSYVLMYDGKKIKRGTDIDLLGFESDPAKNKKERFRNDNEVIKKTLECVKCFINVDTGTEKVHDDGKKEEVGMLVKQCFQIFSNYLKSLRKMKVAKQYALGKYKAKIDKDPSLTKTYQFAIDSCRTSIYLVENCISDILAVQLSVCKAGAFVNGTIKLFAKSKIINVNQQLNAKFLKSVDEMKADLQVDKLPAEKVKQRSEEWFKARELCKVTASVVYSAIGCDGLKRQNEHFDSVFSRIQKAKPDETQRRAMEHGVKSEIHEIATLTGVILPFLYPDLVYQEEGYYPMEGVIVSPDGTLREKDTSSVVFAVEGKAPVGNRYSTTQHYEVPDRYVIQTIFEQKATQASSTLYLCWTDESTTAFLVPMNNDIYKKTQRLISDIYFGEQPKRRTRLSKEAKDLKKDIQAHVGECVYLGEFPSVQGIETGGNIDDAEVSFEFEDLYRNLLKGKDALKQAYNLQRTNASQVLVYLVSDLDRMWKTELPHAVPVMYLYRGYSLTQEIARKLLTLCRKECEGIDIVAIASDGEFIQQIVRGRNGQPLTLYQLNKDVWKEVCSLKKTELVKRISSLNKTYRVSFRKDNRITLESDDDCGPMKTYGWIGLKERAHTKRNMSEKTTTETGSPKNTLTDDKEPLADDNDETIDYDFEEFFHETGQCRTLTQSELHDIFQILKKRRPKKWLRTSQVLQMLETESSMNTFIKDELTDIAKYLNLQLKGSSKELKVTRVKKFELIRQLCCLFGVQVSKEISPKSRIRRNPRKLTDIATRELLKSSYPKAVLNTSYAKYIWQTRVKEWKVKSKVAKNITLKAETGDIIFEPYYVPEFDDEFDDFHVGVYDKTHLGTNLRKCLCLNKVKGVSIMAWKSVSQSWPDILHSSVIEVGEDNKILDQMKEKLAKNMVTLDVESKMRTLGFQTEADFCQIFRAGLFTADDSPGVSAINRCKMRLKLVEWLDKDVDFGKFPPYGGSIKGMSHILYEGLRTSQEAKLYLYALAKSGTYCVRSANTLCSESFFSTMQEMDPWGQGILSGEGVEKHMSDFTTITALKAQEERNIYVKTKKDTVYPLAAAIRSYDHYSQDEQDRELCKCREKKFIQCIEPRDHFFDTPDRARRKSKSEKVYTTSQFSGELKGEQPIRLQYGYKINEAKILPSHRLGLGHLFSDNVL